MSRVPVAVVARAQNANELRSIIDVIHDRWFDLDSLHFDEARGQVSLEILEEADYLRAAKGAHVAPSLKLRVARAKSVKVEDTEHIGYYDLNRIEFDRDAGVVKLLTGAPLTLEISVSALDVSVEELGDE